MGQWEEWAKRTNESIGQQHRAAAVVEEAISALGSIGEPMPAKIRWTSLIQMAPGELGRGRPQEGTLLEFAIALGDMGAYQGGGGERDKVARALSRLGEALLAKGAKPSSRMLEMALAIGLHNLDGPQRVEAAFGWGAASCWEPQKAFALCCAHSSWDEEGGAACQELLIEKGALEGANFSSCAPELHPMLAAAFEGDVPTVKRLVERGLPLDWRDPETGATLWHAACSLSIPMGKVLLPALSKGAPHLAGAATSKALNFTDSRGAQFSVRAGQTPAHCAADGVKPQALEAVLALGADPNAVDGRADTPLTLLSRRWGAKAASRAEPMVKALLGAGADPSRKDGKGRTAAQNMAAKGPLGALAQVLEARPEDVGGDAPQERKAFEALSARGGEGTAQAQEAALRVAVGKEAPKTKGRSRGAL